MYEINKIFDNKNELNIWSATKDNEEPPENVIFAGQLSGRPTVLKARLKTSIIFGILFFIISFITANFGGNTMWI